jgi:thymidylate synthase ThyX
MSAAEQFTPEERALLSRFVTNVDGPVFALVNLPEVVKGALFARYSRSPKDLRRLFLDEFVRELDIDAPVEAVVGLARAEELYERVFVEYGDDSVAQLGGVHLACEQASNVLTKVLEWGRLMSYLEQSTRYIAYDSRVGGRYRYLREPGLLDSSVGALYVGELDAMFGLYAQTVPRLVDYLRQTIPKDPADSDFVYRQAIKAKALDAARGMLPAATLSNVGIYGSGQGYEQLLMRMRAHPLPEARSYADLMLIELRKVIPSFLRRVDIPERGVAWSRYLETNRLAMDSMVERLFGGPHLPDELGVAGRDTSGPRVDLVDFSPGEEELVAAALYPHVAVSERELLDRVRAMSVEQRREIVRAYVGERQNRRHKPGRAFERINYRFDIVADYGAFRDLQRHRLLTCEWQPLAPNHGYDLPALIDEAGCRAQFVEAMTRSASLYDALVDRFPERAAYAVALAYRVRFVLGLNAREAMHLIELRSAPAGHAAYRWVAQEMYRQIRDVARHELVADAMSFVHLGSSELERLEGERRAQARRVGNR